MGDADRGRPTPRIAATLWVERPVFPFLAVDSPADETLFTYPNGAAAVALRKAGEGSAASLFVGAPGLTSELLRFAAHEARVHLFTETDCNVYASGPFVAIHASQDGPITLHLRGDGPVVDLLSGEVLGRGRELNLPLGRGETHVLRCDY